VRTGAPLIIEPAYVPANQPRRQYLDGILDVIQRQAAEVDESGGPGAGTGAGAGGKLEKVCVVVLRCGYLCEEHSLLQHLCQRGCTVCVDAIGCAGINLPHANVTFPGDDRICLTIDALVRAGFPDKIVIAHGFEYKMSLTCGGGPGLRHCPSSFTNRLRRLLGPMQEDVVKAVMNANLLRLLTYYVPPPPPKEETKVWTCDACKKGLSLSLSLSLSLCVCVCVCVCVVCVCTRVRPNRDCA